jgi:energy-coupling factor transport system permease protein
MRVPVIQTGRDSFMRRRDPRVKVAMFIMLILFIYLAPNWVWMAGMVGVGVLLAVLSRAPVRWLAVLLALQIPNMLGLIIIPAIGQLWAGDFAFDSELQFGVKLALAWVAAILIGVSIISSMEIDELVEGMKGIGVPKRLAFAVGYVFLLAYLGFNDILRITEAMRLKGMELSLKRPFGMLADIVRMTPPMVFTVVRRGANMSAALNVRGFSPAKDHVRRAHLKFDFADAAAICIAVVIVGYAGVVKAKVVQPPADFLAPTEKSKEAA